MDRRSRYACGMFVPSTAWGTLSGIVLATVLQAQAPGAVRATVPVDPYTMGEPAALKKAGYESFGPFAFGGGHSSVEVADLLGSEPLIWIETTHFRIGCSLSRLPLKNDEPWHDEWVARLKQELKRLSTRLPRVKTDLKELDPWLRAHLIAQRAEELYAEVRTNFGLEEFTFPVAPDDLTGDPTKYRGNGPHLGNRGKYMLLLLQRSSSHARYTRAFQGREMADPVRHYDVESGAMYWGAAEETADGLFRQDYALQAHVAFNLAHNLYSSYRGYTHGLPAWLVTGLAHWHSRRVCPRFPTYDRKNDTDKDPRSAFWEWEKRVPGLLKNEAFGPVETLLEGTNAGAFGLEQHMQSWALVDFLMTTQKAKFMQFVHSLKDPFHEGRQLPTDIELRVRQLDSLRAFLGLTPAGLEETWRGFVLGGKGRR